MLAPKTGSRNQSLSIVILLTVFLLTIIGIFFIYSASAIFAAERYASEFHFARKQLLAAIIGFFLLGIISKIPEKFIKKITFFLFITTLLATVATLIPGIGIKVHGARRWLSLVVIIIHPSELLKVFFILESALFLSKQNSETLISRKKILSYLLITGICCAILLAQPDFGSAVLIASIAVSLLFIINGELSFFLYLASSITAIATFLIIIAPYRIRRILIFLNPWNDPQGAGFQTVQSLIAIGTGGFLGNGIGASKQKLFYLPMQHTDFIFSIIAEEIGFIGCFVLLTLYTILTFTLIRASIASDSKFGKLIISGTATLLSLQALMNMSVATGLIPTKGTCLPFVSYGNSSLISGLILIGFVLAALSWKGDR